MGRLSRLGLFGGSFDPIHLGHLLVAEQAREQLGLDRVLVIPAARSPFKPEDEPSAGRHRAAMIERAIADHPAFALERCELERPPPSRTVDTVEHLRGRYGRAADFWWILGEDALAGFPCWHRPDDILAELRLAVFGRPGSELDLAMLERELPALRGRVDRIEGPRIDISATDLRRRARQERSLRYQVMPAVEDYIRSHGLYRDAAAEVEEASR